MICSCRLNQAVIAAQACLREQQIRGKHFTFDSIEKISRFSVIDSNFNIMYDENGNVIMKDLEQPINLIKGTWGAKTKLTENDPDENTAGGMFKRSFNCGVLNTGELFCACNSCDQSYEKDTISIFNNRLVFSRFKLSELFTDEEDFSKIEFSNDYPSPGDTVKITVTNTNRGFMTDDNVNVSLPVNGEKYDEKTIDHRFADEEK